MSLTSFPESTIIHSHSASSLRFSNNQNISSSSQKQIGNLQIKINEKINTYIKALKKREEESRLKSF